MFKVRARTDVHVQSRDGNVVFFCDRQAFVQLLMPNAVLGRVTASVGFSAVPMAKTGIDSQRNFATRRR